MRLSTLEALLSLLLDAPQPLVEHVPSLLPRLLELGKTAGTMVSYEGMELCHFWQLWCQLKVAIMVLCDKTSD